MKMKRLLTVLFTLLFLNSMFCQENEKEILTIFFEKFESSPSEALDYIYSTNKWIDGNGDAIKQLKGKFNQYEELLGEYLGEEFIFKSKLGSSFASHVYFAKFDRQPLRFTFTFYKAKDVWVLYSFKFDDSFDKDFEEMQKISYMDSRLY